MQSCSEFSTGQSGFTLQGRVRILCATLHMHAPRHATCALHRVLTKELLYGGSVHIWVPGCSLPSNDMNSCTRQRRNDRFILVMVLDVISEPGAAIKNACIHQVQGS
jgi:hypothetical protein